MSRTYAVLHDDAARDMALLDSFKPRQCDVVEWGLISGHPMVTLLAYFMQESPVIWAGVNDAGETTVIAGVNAEDLLADIGVPWMVCSDDLPRYRRAFLAESRAGLSRALDIYPRLVNYVHADNRSAMAWLRRIGFTVADEPIPYGPYSAPFHRFELEV